MAPALIIILKYHEPQILCRPENQTITHDFSKCMETMLSTPTHAGDMEAVAHKIWPSPQKFGCKYQLSMLSMYINSLSSFYLHFNSLKPLKHTLGFFYSEL